MNVDLGTRTLIEGSTRHDAWKQLCEVLLEVEVLPEQRAITLLQEVATDMDYKSGWSLIVTARRAGWLRGQRQGAKKVQLTVLGVEAAERLTRSER